MPYPSFLPSKLAEAEGARLGLAVDSYDSLRQRLTTTANGSCVGAYAACVASDGLFVGMQQNGSGAACGGNHSGVTSQGFDEVTIVIAGKLALTEAGSTAAREIAANDVVFLPRGWRGTMDVLQPVSRLRIVMTSLPLNRERRDIASESLASLWARLQGVST